MEIFSDVKDYFKSRLTNPFLGTMLMVWIIRNWLLVYSLFTFDSNFTWKDKVEFIQNYFYSKVILLELWTNIWMSFLILGLTYLLLMLSRLLANGYEALIPYTYSLFNKSKIVLKETHKRVLKSNSDLTTANELLEEKVHRIQEELKISNASLSSQLSKNFELQSRLEEASKEVAELKAKHETNDMIQILESDLKSLKEKGYERTKDVDYNEYLFVAEDFILTDRYDHLSTKDKSNVLKAINNINFKQFYEDFKNFNDEFKMDWYYSLNKLQPYIEFELLHANKLNENNEVHRTYMTITDLGRLLFRHLQSHFDPK